MVAITTRGKGVSAKGAPLTNDELDDNFINLNNACGLILDPAPGCSWNFDGTSLDGWSGSGATVTSINEGISVVATGNDPQILSPNALSFPGGAYPIVRAKITRKAGSGWEGLLFYATAGHGFSQSYLKQIPNPVLAVGESAIVEWDMSGIADWMASIPTRLRLDIGSTTADQFDVDWIVVGRFAIGAGQADVKAIQAALSTISGGGTNLMPAEYTYFTDTIPPLSIQSGVTLDLNVDPTDYGGARLRTVSTTAIVTWVRWAKAADDYNLRLKPNTRYLFSFTTVASAARTGKVLIAYPRASDGANTEFTCGNFLSQTTKSRVTVSFVTPADLVDRAYMLTYGAITGVATTISYDMLMLEEQPGPNAIASDFVPGKFDVNKVVNKVNSFDADVSLALATYGVGVPQGLSSPNYLGANVDLNTMTTSGDYGQPLNANATPALNYPVAKAGSLEVRAGGSTIVTQAYKEYNTGRIWTRSKYSTTWYPWVMVWDTGVLVKTANQFDNTPGSMTQVGDFGLGATTPAYMTTSIDDFTIPNGTYSISSVNVGTKPPGQTFGVLEVKGRNNIAGSGSRVVQHWLLTDGSGDAREWVRHVSTSTPFGWTNWVEIQTDYTMAAIGLTNNNLTPITNIDSFDLANGFYSVSTSTTTGTKPATFGVLEVKGREFTVGRVVQVFNATDSAGFVTATWRRLNYGRQWGAWTKDPTADDVALKADKDSPALTGTPTSTKPPVDDATSRIATTEWMYSQGSSTPAAPLGTSASLGTSSRWARSDHVHQLPTLDALMNVTITANSNGEILRWNGSAWINNTLAEAGIAPVASPAFTGNPTATTQAATDSSTRLATTGYVNAWGAQYGYGHTTAPSVDGTVAARNSGNYYYAQAVSPYPDYAFAMRHTYSTSRGFEIANIPYLDRFFARACNSDGTWRTPVELADKAYTQALVDLNRGNFNNSLFLAANSTLLASAAGGAYQFNAAGLTTTLPDPSTLPRGASFTFRNYQNGIQTLSSTSIINEATATTLVINAYEWVTLAADSAWRVVGRGTLKTPVNTEAPNLKGELTISGTNVLRFVNEGSTTAPALITRIDGSNFYLMLTNASDQLGNYNALRPFRIGLTTGNVDIATALTCASPTAGDRSTRAATTTWVGAEFDSLVAGKEPSLTAGSNTQFYRGDKTWQDIRTAVVGAVLTGLSTATATAVAATDSILTAIGKLQAQINNKEGSIAAGAATTFWRGDKSWTDFATTVRAAVLTGLNNGATGTVAATDNILTAIGKLQKQATDVVGVNTNITSLRASKYLDPIIVANATGTYTCDLTNTSTWELTLTGNTTLAFSNSPSIPANTIMTVLITVKQGATAYALTLPSGTTLITPGGAAILTPAANKQQDYIFTTKNGTAWEVRAGAFT